MEMSECIHIYDNSPLETEESASNPNGGSDELEERIVDIYDTADNCGVHHCSPYPEEAELQNTADQWPGNIRPEKSRSWVVTVCVLLLCVLLLAGITGLVVHYKKVEGSLEERLLMCHLASSADRDKLQSHNKTWAEKRKQTLVELNRFCEAGCKSFNSSFYYFSTTQKNWEDSREDCLAKGADLVIINSEEEQKFINSLNKVSWIGLSDRDEEGTWRWVDGTFLNSTKFWPKNEPSGAHGRVKEDCADAFWYTDLYSWNDDACTTAHYWVCEKLIDL